MKILVTGANGFIGAAICEELPAGDFEIYRINGKRNSGKFPKRENSFSIDITDKNDLSEVEKLGQIDVLIHCAGLAHQFGAVSCEDFEKVNVAGTGNIAELAVKLNVKHFVQISSVSVYGGVSSSEKRITEERQICQPDGDYGRSKLKGEYAARRICETNKINLTILRLATVCGVGDRGNVLKLIRAIDGGKFFWIGKGNNLKSLIYVGDVAKICRRIVKSKRPGTEIFNLSAEAETMSEIVSTIEKSLGVSVPKSYVPAGLVQNFLKLNNLFKFQKIAEISDKLNKWLREDAYSPEKIFREYGFRAETSVSAALEKEVAWYKDNKKK